MRKKQPEKVYLQEPAEHYLHIKDIQFIHLKTSITRNIHGQWITFPVESNKGWSDLIVFLGIGKTLFIEFKWGKNKLKDYQNEKKGILEAMGYKYYVIKEFDVFKDLIDKLNKKEK